MKLNNKLIIKVLMIFFCTVLVFNGAIFAQNNSKNENMMQDILDKADKIKSAESNVTTATQLLAALPEPDFKPSVAVFNISDKTGQRQETGGAVVTQGATDMLITALMRSRQFKVVDRTNLQDFMNEQNLKANDRLADGEGPELGEMTGADYVIDGAITEYQVNKSTGGIGVKIAGVGGSKEKAVASTAIDIRVIDTTTSEVVWARSLKDKIVGKKIGVQAFSFMGNNIVEFESGNGKQEVINLVVRTLLEEAVFNLVESEVL
jgi:curli biogenesis system outer membrane secretion channel CsgG